MNDLSRLSPDTLVVLLPRPLKKWYAESFIEPIRSLWQLEGCRSFYTVISTFMETVRADELETVSLGLAMCFACFSQLRYVCHRSGFLVGVLTGFQLGFCVIFSWLFELGYQYHFHSCVERLVSEVKLAFLKVICRWKFGFGSLAFFVTVYLAWQLILDPVIT